MKEKLYSASDRQLEEMALEKAGDKEFFATLKNSALEHKKRAESKISDFEKRHKKFLESLPDESREQMTSLVSGLEKKRQRSKSGLVGALVRQGHIKQEYVLEDGTLDRESLAADEYFQQNPHLLEVLSAYQLSKRSKLRRGPGKEQTSVEEHKNPQQEAKVVYSKPSPAGNNFSREKQGRTNTPKKTEASLSSENKPGRHKVRRRAGRITASVAAVAVLAGGGMKASGHEIPERDNVELNQTSVSVYEAIEEAGKKIRKENKRLNLLKKVRVKARSQWYTIRSGDTLWEIADNEYGNGEYWPKIAQANCNRLPDPDVIGVDQHIRIPEKKKGRFFVTYIVKSGDTLSQIAEKKCSRVDAIVNSNSNIKDKDLIYPKQVLDVPVKRQPVQVAEPVYQNSDNSGSSNGQDAYKPSSTGYGGGGADHSPSGVISLIRQHWPDHLEEQAIEVASCESGLGADEYNEHDTALGQHAQGVFQFIPTTWDMTSFRNHSTFNDAANIQAAYELFRDSGNSWSHWACKP